MKLSTRMPKRLAHDARVSGFRLALETARQLDRVASWLVKRVQHSAAAEEAHALTAWSYTKQTQYVESWHREAGLFDFELAALSRFFPAPPAHLLVHGAGGGRETHALLARGYRVTPAEPIAALVQTAQHAFADRATVVHAGLQSAAVGALAGPFDAVIIGWSAYGHLLEASARIAALRALRTACPHGPILLSWRECPPQRGLRGSAQTVRAVAGRPEPLPERAISNFGVFHAVLDEPKLRHEAEAASSRVAYFGSHGDAGYPNAVLMPAER